MSLASALLAQSSASQSAGVADGQVTINIEFAQPFAQVSAGTPVRVSGTEANFSVGVTAIIHDPATMTVQEAKLWIGGEEVTLPNGFDGGTVRFAPTRFLSFVSSLSVKWQVKVRVQCPAHALDETKTLVVELPFEHWNKAIVYGTRLDGNGLPSLLFEGASSSATFLASSQFASRGHDVSPTSDHLDVAKASIQGWLHEATAYFAMAHGDASGVNDSYGWQQQASQYLTFAPEIQSPLAPRNGNGIPKFRYALLYSCSTLIENSDSPWPKFNPQDLDGAVRDSAYCGFKEVVLPVLAAGNTNEWVDGLELTSYLSTHTADLLMHWGGGPVSGPASERTIENSVAYANGRKMPRGLAVDDPSFPSGKKHKAVPIEYRGDKRTTLRTVYLTQAERDAADLASFGPTTWYYVWNN